LFAGFDSFAACLNGIFSWVVCVFIEFFLFGFKMMFKSQLTYLFFFLANLVVHFNLRHFFTFHLIKNFSRIESEKRVAPQIFTGGGHRF